MDKQKQAEKFVMAFLNNMYDDDTDINFVITELRSIGLNDLADCFEMDEHELKNYGTYIPSSWC